MKYRITVADLTVMTAIFVVATVLVVQAIVVVRELSQRQRCLNNLKYMGLAIQNFESNFQRLPTLCDFGGGSPTGGGLVSLHFQIIPFIEGGAVYPAQPYPNSYCDKDRGIAKAKYKAYVCPADPFAFDEITSTSRVTGIDSPFTGTYSTTNYVANGLIFRNGADLKSISDGQSNTIMFAERYQKCKLSANSLAPTISSPEVYTFWALGAYSSTTPAFALVNPKTEPYPVGSPPNVMFVPKSSFEHDSEAIGYFADSPHQPVQFAKKFSTAKSGFQIAPSGATICDARIPQTPHRAGMLVCLADGSTRCLAGNFRSFTFWSAVTPAGNEILGGDW